MEEEKPKMMSATALRLYEERYARSCDGNDQKATRLFKEYEAREALERLRGELLAIKNDALHENVIIRWVGKKRIAKHGSAKDWARLMMIWLAKKD